MRTFFDLLVLILDNLEDIFKLLPYVDRTRTRIGLDWLNCWSNKDANWFSNSKFSFYFYHFGFQGIFLLLSTDFVLAIMPVKSTQIELVS